MGFFSDLWHGIVGYAKRFWNAIKRIFVAIVSMVTHVINYFKSLFLNPKTDKPFIGDYSKLKEAIHNAPVRDCGIFRGVYNETTDEITVLENIEANTIDSETKRILGNDSLVVLT